MDDTYDDGLVHSHGWATDLPAHTGAAKPLGAETAAPMSAHPEEESFDDGLVHGHDWARG